MAVLVVRLVVLVAAVEQEKWELRVRDPLVAKEEMEVLHHLVEFL